MKPWRTVSLFSPREVSAAFAALQAHATDLYPDVSSQTLLSHFAHHRGGERGYRRDHLELPLQHLCDNTAVYLQLPAEVRHICTGLHAAASAYVEEAVREPSSSLWVLPLTSSARAELKHNLGKKSVLRVLRYPVGSGCRPHVDPGFCTALLTGSAGGLEVNTHDEIPVSFTNRPGDYTTRANTEVSATAASSPAATEADAENVLDLLPHWEPVITAHAGEAVVMAGNMMGVVSGGVIPGVLHRVRRDWGEAETTLRRPLSLSADSRPPLSALSANRSIVESSAAPPPPEARVQREKSGEDSHSASVRYRFNIIVELRPAQPKRWYAASKLRPSTAKAG